MQDLSQREFMAANGCSKTAHHFMAYTKYSAQALARPTHL